MRAQRFAIVIEKDSDGYFAICPGLQGCSTQGDTYDEALSNMRDAIKLHVGDRLEAGEEVSVTESVHLASLEIVI